MTFSLKPCELFAFMKDAVPFFAVQSRVQKQNFINMRLVTLLIADVFESMIKISTCSINANLCLGLVFPTMLSPALELFIFRGALCFRTYRKNNDEPS
jgi:hypothetical protein